ncbi:hypothetical protein ASG52_25465 [Methylobacterium sp. Leaf456]|uniref:hypothetical protein n=1 Tax=Methylobacterium sp. Leaf456 TaxID=1736382 RepID=UPI0006FC7B65|nr:hypothetical protein [Methylobacterium sp. Leaf456]KQT52745.1 hypothetical protein ASG52_25465 [Methylobacterium sp. Leaf456]
MTARRRLTGFGAPLLALTLVSLPAAAGPFDGAWSVQAVAETGACSGPYNYPIAIRNGVLEDTGAKGVDASGRASADGRIRGTIRTGLARIAVSGRLRGMSGAGEWTLGGLGACSGRWTAQRMS